MYFSFFTDAISHLTCVIIWFPSGSPTTRLWAQFWQEPDLILLTIVSLWITQCPKHTRKSLYICWLNDPRKWEYSDSTKKRLKSGLTRIFVGSCFTLRKVRLSFQLHWEWVQALHCIGHKEILRWITSGGSKIHIKSIDRRRMCVSRRE